MRPLIARDARRSDPVYVDSRHRVLPRLRQRRLPTTVVLSDAVPIANGARDVRHFLTAFMGGLVVFSILIF